MQEEVQREGAGLLDGTQLHAAPLPGAHQEIDADGQRKRHPAAVRELHGVGAQEGEVDQEEAAHQAGDAELRPAPPRARHDSEQQRRDRHRPGHRDAVGRAEVARIPEGEHEHEAAHHQCLVDLRDVDLPRLLL